MPNRIDAIRRAAAQWKNDVLDVTNRNSLLNFRDLKRGTLDLTPSPSSAALPIQIDHLLAGRATKATGIFAGQESKDDALLRLRTIHKNARAQLEEKGLDTLFAAVGLASWESAEGKRRNAPVILVPFMVNPESISQQDFQLKRSGDAHLNPVLTYVLKTEFGIGLSEEDEENLIDDLPTSFDGMIERLRDINARWSAAPNLDINPRIVLGNFRYTNMPLVVDLEANLADVARSNIVAAIAGVEEARRELRAAIQDPPLNRPDRDSPSSEFLVLDADSSQHRAINRALGGESLVIWGPPGTGKSQTIANLIAALISSEKRVLFVAEKRAAIDVVINRLKQVGLADLVMDLHGGGTTKREFARSLDYSIRVFESIPSQDHSNVHRHLAESRDELIAHNDAVHRRREPWGISVFEVQLGLLGSPAFAQDSIRIDPAKANIHDQLGIEQLKRKVERWVELDGSSVDSKYPEWGHSRIVTSAEAEAGFGQVQNLSRRLRRVCASYLDSLAAVGMSNSAERFSEWPDAARLHVDIENFLSQYKPQIYELDLAVMAEELIPMATTWRRFVGLFFPRYRAVKKLIQDQRRDRKALDATATLDVINEAIRQKRLWEDNTGNSEYPFISNRLAASLKAMREVQEDLAAVGHLLNIKNLADWSYQQLVETLERMQAQQYFVARLPIIRSLESELADGGFGPVIAAVGTEVPLEIAADALETVWLRAVWDQLLFSDQNLAAFDAVAHTRCRDQFIDHDRQHLQLTPARIWRAAAEKAISVMSYHPEETALVRREAAKKTRHISTRRLFQRAPNVLSAIRPCWMMSPLLVAETTPVGDGVFDVVIFDEASQIPPAEAIGCLARAPQVVIAGDDRQLPPTTFFDKQTVYDDESEDGGLDTALTTDIESILDVAKSGLFREEMLRWHYRSRDDRLIAFSNTHLYDESLSTFPGTDRESPFTHDVVPFRRLPRKNTRSHPDEVDRVVELVIDHARNRPNESLGVIAFGMHHANNIEEFLRLRLRDTPDQSLRQFFSDENAEPFFVKNIERVQGDERDAIILSVGYHKAANGTLPYRFGPLNQEGGERRLNVAITRARSRLQLVSSFTHHDMKPGKSRARGVRLLRQFLEYAAGGGNNLSGVVTDVALNSFEEDVLSALKEMGIPATPQYGVSGYRIDFACAHPESEGRMVLAVEADGASYHSLPTARERDRLRQSVLEGQGWKFHRIWSTDWFKSRQREVDRVFEAWQQAVRTADEADQDDRRGQSSGASSFRPKNHLGRSINLESRPRTDRPAVEPNRGNIYMYSQTELADLARWILSDTQLRTDEKLRKELMQELGFKRGGRRINPVLDLAIASARDRKIGTGSISTS